MKMTNNKNTDWKNKGRRDERRRSALERNDLSTYKCAVSGAVQYHALGPFEVLYNYCGFLRNASLIV